MDVTMAIGSGHLWCEKTILSRLSWR